MFNEKPSISHAATAWRQELKSLEFWCGAFPLFLCALAATTLVLGVSADTFFIYTAKIICLLTLIFLPAHCQLIRKFKNLGKNFVQWLPPLLCPLPPQPELSFIPGSDRFLSHHVVPPKEPPRRSACKKADHIFTSLLFLRARHMA